MNLRNRKQKGFSLIEMVVTLLVATLLTGLFLILVNFAKKTYVQMQELSEGQVLCSNLTNAIQDEYRYATLINYDTGNPKHIDNVAGPVYDFTFVSGTLGAGERCRIISHEDEANKKRIYIQVNPTEVIDGQVYELYALIGNDSYIYNLSADIDSKYEPDSKKIYVTITISDAISNDELVKSVFEVEPLNKYW